MSVGIYDDSFIDYLATNLKCNPKITSNNIIAKCPFCLDQHEKEGKDHYHLYISLEAPIFHCFQAECDSSGVISKLIKEIEGTDKSDKFVDKNKLKELKKKNLSKKRKEKTFKVSFPKIYPESWPNKTFYLKKRLKFSNIDINSIKGLVFDVYEFIRINDIVVDSNLYKMQDFLHRNFIGFVTRNNQKVIFRNTDPKSSFRYYVLKLSNRSFLDYYSIKRSSNYLNNIVVLSEGVFDIFNEFLFDSVGLKNHCNLYASAHSDKYGSLLKSISLDEQLFRINVHILSDNGCSIDYYKKIKKFNSHLIDTMTVYYNKAGKDFGESSFPTKFVI